MGRERVVALVGVSALVAVLAGVAVVVSGDDGGGPRPLPIGGAVASARSAGGAEDGDAADLTMAAGVEYRLEGDLPRLAGEAHAWRQASGAPSDEAVQALARALGVDGRAERADGYVTLREGDGQLQVWEGPGGSWWYSPVAVEEVIDVAGSDEGGGSSGEVATGVEEEEQAKVDAEAARREAGSSGSAGATAPGSGECPPDADCQEPRPLERPADLPSEAEARSIAVDLFAATGLDVDDADVRVDDGITSWWVTASPRLGGLPVIGLDWTATVGPRGEVLGASGWLAAPDREDRYPLVSTAEAYDRLQETGGGWFAIAGVAEGEATAKDTPASSDVDVDAPDVPAQDDVATDPAVECVDCRPEPSDPFVIEVTGAHLGLLSIGDYLVPAVVFESSAGDLPVIALRDEHIVEPEPADPAPLPEPDPSEPSDPGDPAPDPSTTRRCATTDAQVGPSTEVCVAVDGRDAVVTLSAVDNAATIRDDCGSPTVAWGDREGTAVCEIGCVSGSGSGSSGGGGTSTVKWSSEHTYARAGAYTVEVTVESNCGEAPGGRAVVSLDIDVE